MLSWYGRWLPLAACCKDRRCAREENGTEAGEGGPLILGTLGLHSRPGAHAENFSAGPKPQLEYLPSANATKKQPVLGPRREGRQRPLRGPSPAARPGKPLLSLCLGRPPPSNAGEYLPSANTSKKRPVLGLRHEGRQRPLGGPRRAARPGKPLLPRCLGRPPPSNAGEYFPSANASKKWPVSGPRRERRQADARQQRL